MQRRLVAFLEANADDKRVSYTMLERGASGRTTVSAVRRSALFHV